MKTVRSVAVLGAGTMGSRIAAHFANAGVPALLLDVTSEATARGLEAVLRQRPPAFFTKEARSLITEGNFDENLEAAGGADWILEAVTEDLDIKRQLWSRVALAAGPRAILSTNTSGIPLRRIADGFSPDFRRRFLGTHFFNPPRYLHLLELIPGPETDPELLAFAASFAERRLGKGVVPCKDTPNFIANRIGSFFGATVYKILMEDDYTIEEADALTGPLIGLPNSASFRLLDIVGLDVWAFVARNLYEAVPGDPWRGRLLPPPFLTALLERGWLGEKSGQGFYKRAGKEIHALDWRTLDYHPAEKPRLPVLETARFVEDLGARLRMLIETGDRAGAFLWKLFSDVLLYSAERVPEISDRIVEIDRAMRWGYAHKLGPFELWDALGFEPTARRLEREGRRLPDAVAAMLSSGAKSFYRPADADGGPRTEYYDLCGHGYREVEPNPAVLRLADLKRARGVVLRNPGASLVDLGDGVLCLEFHSKMNALGVDHVSMLYAGLEETERNFQALVIANEGENFSAGANLALLLARAQEGDWTEIDIMVRRFQQATMALKYAACPVVTAPFARTLGGGCEIVLHSPRAQASAELYMGLVETGVGLIPAAGGCKEMLLRTGSPREAFELIGQAKVSSSAADAVGLRLLRAEDGISMNPEHLIADAKHAALEMARSYVAPARRAEIKAGGEPARALMKLAAWTARQGGYISDYDVAIAERLAHVLSGGRVTPGQMVSEEHLLDLEREAFLGLCGNAATQERIQHMLKTGKPLRN